MVKATVLFSGDNITEIKDILAEHFDKFGDIKSIRVEQVIDEQTPLLQSGK